MSVRYLAETSVREVQSLIKANIAQALSDIRNDRGDSKVSTEIPQSYFIYEKALMLKTPALFTIVRDINFQKEKYQANFITAKVGMNVSIVIEDKDSEKLTIKAWRYQAALHEILDQQQILVEPNKAKLFLIVQDALFSPIYTTKTSQTTAGVFRQEMALNLEVQQMESF